MRLVSAESWLLLSFFSLSQVNSTRLSSVNVVASRELVSNFDLSLQLKAAAATTKETKRSLSAAASAISCCCCDLCKTFSFCCLLLGKRGSVSGAQAGFVLVWGQKALCSLWLQSTVDEKAARAQRANSSLAHNKSERNLQLTHHRLLLLLLLLQVRVTRAQVKASEDCCLCVSKCLK